MKEHEKKKTEKCSKKNTWSLRQPVIEVIKRMVYDVIARLVLKVMIAGITILAAIFGIGPF